MGRVSVEALAATAMGRSIFFATAAIGLGVGLSVEPLASQALGAGEPERAWSALRASLRAGAMVALLGLAIAFASTLALAPAGIDPALLPGVRAFLIGHAPGAIFFPAFIAGRAYLQAQGDARPALLAAALANAVNLVACSLLVRGDDALADLGLPPLGLPRLGALGAGLSGSVGVMVLAGVVLAAARRRRPAPARRAEERAAPPVSASTVLRLGVPVGLHFAAEMGLFTVVALAAGRLGAASVSAHQIAIGIASFTFMGTIGVSGATSVRVGHAVGEGRSARAAGLLGIGVGAAFMAVCAVVLALFPHALMRIFTPDAEVIAIGVPLLGLAAIFQIFDGVQGVAAGALRGAGDVRLPFLANVTAQWAIGFPLAIWLGFGMGLGARGLWMGITAGLMVSSVLLTARFVRLTRGVIARV